MTLPSPLRSGPGWRLHRPAKPPTKAPPAPFPFAAYRDALTGRFTASGGLSLTRYRDALTGQFRSDPAAGERVGRAVGQRPERGGEVGLIVLTRLIVWEDGEREAIGCRVIWPALRAARLRGEVAAAACRELEAELGADRLAELNPARARELELEQLHAAHRSDKGKRAAESRKRNAAARSAEAARNPNRRVSL